MKASVMRILRTYYKQRLWNRNRDNRIRPDYVICVTRGIVKVQFNDGTEQHYSRKSLRDIIKVNRYVTWKNEINSVLRGMDLSPEDREEIRQIICANG